MSEFDDLPIKQVRPTMTDDDVDFHCDLIYMRALLNDVVELSHMVRHANPLPVNLSDQLAAAYVDCRALTWTTA